jgi:hypothetical protein
MAYVKAILKAGYEVGVHDGEEKTLDHTSDPMVAKAHLFTTDEDYLLIKDQLGNQVGWMRMIYGNEPGVVCSDFSDNAITNAIYEAVEHYREAVETMA